MTIDWIKVLSPLLAGLLSAAGAGGYVQHQQTPREDAYASMAKVLMHDLEACRAGTAP